MKFTVTAPGTIVAVRYWKPTAESGSHSGKIWASNGTLLSSVAFVNETASGWQTAQLATPLQATVGTVYIVSVNSNGYFSDTYGGLASAIASGGLASVPDGMNGLFGSPGLFPNLSYRSSNYFRDVLFQPQPTTTAIPVSLLTGLSPQLPSASDGRSYELGVKFKVSVTGNVTAVKFWKAAGETGSHVGRLWDASGNLVASVTFANETASGWQQASFATPVPLTPGLTYTVSVNSNAFFADTYDALGQSLGTPPIATIADGANGVYGNAGAYPQYSYRNSNYFRDVVFQPQ